MTSFNMATIMDLTKHYTRILKLYARLKAFYCSWNSLFLRMGKMAQSWLGQRDSLGLQKKKKANKQNKKLVSLYFVGVIDLKLITD